MNVIAAQLEKAAGETVNLRASATPLQESLAGKSRRSLIMLLARQRALCERRLS